MSKREHLLTDPLEGEQLATVNRVLRWHGIREMGPCQVGDVLGHLAPMEMGRYAHIMRHVVEALEGTVEDGS